MAAPSTTANIELAETNDTSRSNKDDKETQVRVLICCQAEAGLLDFSDR